MCSSAPTHADESVDRTARRSGLRSIAVGALALSLRTSRPADQPIRARESMSLSVLCGIPKQGSPLPSRLLPAPDQYLHGMRRLTNLRARGSSPGYPGTPSRLTLDRQPTPASSSRAQPPTVPNATLTDQATATARIQSAGPDARHRHPSRPNRLMFGQGPPTTT
jgi:hypothetical protein